MFQRRRRTPSRNRRGAMLVLIAVIMPVFCMMAAFAVDVAWMQLVRTELRTATDSAARAGAKILSIEQSIPLARAAARDAALRNIVGGEQLRIRDTDVLFGHSAESPSTGKFVFVEGDTPTNAVHVDGLRTAGSAAGAVSLFFGSILGTSFFEPVQSATSTALERDICLVIDRSGSMGLPVSNTGGGNGQNCGPLDADTRFVALSQAVSDFLAELDLTLPAEQVALVSYSSQNSIACGGTTINFEIADTRQPLTTNYAAIRAQMTSFVQDGIGGRTAIGEGLAEGLRAIRSARPFALKTVVLMTDGRHNTSFEPIIPARDAAREDIVVHTVTFSRGAEQDRMINVANETGGRHFHADTTSDLREAFREIARTFPVLLTD